MHTSNACRHAQVLIQTHGSSFYKTIVLRKRDKWRKQVGCRRASCFCRRAPRLHFGRQHPHPHGGWRLFCTSPCTFSWTDVQCARAQRPRQRAHIHRGPRVGHTGWWLASSTRKHVATHKPVIRLPLHTCSTPPAPPLAHVVVPEALLRLSKQPLCMFVSGTRATQDTRMHSTVYLHEVEAAFHKPPQWVHALIKCKGRIRYIE